MAVCFIGGGVPVEKQQPTDKPYHIHLPLGYTWALSEIKMTTLEVNRQ